LNRLLTPLHRLGLQIYTAGVIIAALIYDFDWRVLLGGALILPLLAEGPVWHPGPDRRPRPADWAQPDEIVLRARELWQILLRRAFWAAWLIGWILADEVSAFLPETQLVTGRAVAIVGTLILAAAGAFFSRRIVSAWVILKASKAVKAEGVYPVA